MKERIPEELRRLGRKEEENLLAFAAERKRLAMKKKATFSREQLSKSKTFGYGKDLVLAVLEDRDYTKDEAEKEIQAYLTGEREGI